MYYNELIDYVMNKSSIRRSRRRTEDFLFGAALLRMLVGEEELEDIGVHFPAYPAFCREVKRRKVLSDSDYDIIFNNVLSAVALRDNALELVALVHSLDANEEAVQEVLVWCNYRDFSLSDDTGSVIDELGIKILQGGEKGPYDTFFNCCSGQGNVLAIAVSYQLAKQYCGQDISRKSNRMADIRLRALQCKADLYSGDVLTEPRFTKTSQQFDRIYGNVPFVSPKKIFANKGVELPLTAKTSSVWDFIDVILHHLKDDGKAVVMVQTGSLFKKTDRQIREKLVEDKKIEGIIALPKGLLTYSPLRVSLVVLSNGNSHVRMVNAEKIFTTSHRFADKDKIDIDALYDLYCSRTQDLHAVDVSLEDIRDKQYKLLPASYIAGDEMVFKNGVPIADVCQVIRGKVFTGSRLEEIKDTASPYGYINSANVDIVTTIDNSTRIHVEDPRAWEKHEIHHGDIVLSARSTTIKVGTAEIKPGEHLLAGANVLVLRPKADGIDPIYLMMLLQSKTGAKLLDSIQTGARIITITPRSLEDLVIPVPPLRKQAEMAAAYRKHLQKIISLQAEIQEAQRKMEDLYEIVDVETRE